MPQTSRWFGETREWNVSELNFMVEALTHCRMLQEEGKCERGGGCVNCKYSAAVTAIDQLDPFTKGRLEDKADKYEQVIARADATNRYIKRKAARSKCALLFWLLTTGLIIFTAASLLNGCTNRYNVSVTKDIKGKWNILPEEPYFYNKSYYDCEGTVNKVMVYLKTNGPTDWYYDGTTDCKDWACSFVELWYDTYGATDGTCFLVRNVNPETRMDHLFVAVYSLNKGWIFIEPQACKSISYYMKDFWGSKYDETCNCYNETRKFIEKADKYTGNCQKKEHLIKATLTDKTYTVQWWDDTHPIQYHTDKW